MGQQYVSQYRCKLCGKVFPSTNVGTEFDTVFNIMNALIHKNKRKYSPDCRNIITREKIHYCDDNYEGSCGVAEFIGFEERVFK